MNNDPGKRPDSGESVVPAGNADADGKLVEDPSQTALRDHVVDALKTCFDPEIPVDIYELGLIYEIEVKSGGDVIITMTLTSPACPVAGSLPLEVEEKVNAVDGVATVRVDVTWNPPWTPDRMSDVARLELNL